MDRAQQHPLGYDIFALLAAYGLREDLSLRDPAAVDGFVSAARERLTYLLSQPHFLHGHRTQAMFEAMVSSLGAVALIKREDTGPFHSTVDGVSVAPDFRLVLEDGSPLLVEVKNYKTVSPFSRPFTIRSAEFDSLCSYAELMGCPLRLAVYWAGVNRWTLVPPEALAKRGTRRTLTFVDAMFANDMAALGDLMVGTKSPLRIKLLADPAETRSIDERGQVLFKIGDVKLYCADREICDAGQRNIATYLVLNGNWVETATVETTGNLLDAAVFTFQPLEDSGQGFDIIGDLSSMFSQYYLQATSTEGSEVSQVLARFTPGHVGRLIPRDYAGKELPLWRFALQSTTASRLAEGAKPPSKRGSSPDTY